MKKNIHQEFAFQSRELGAQIEDTLGNPPNRKNYTRVIQSLISEFAKGTEIDDVNLLSFALIDYLSFDDPAGLLAQCKQYEGGDPEKVVAMVSCTDEDAAKALAKISADKPVLARQAILTAFLFKNNKRWSGGDKTIDELQHEEEKNENISENHNNFSDDDDGGNAPGQDVIDLFDTREDRNG